MGTEVEFHPSGAENSKSLPPGAMLLAILGCVGLVAALASGTLLDPQVALRLSAGVSLLVLAGALFTHTGRSSITLRSSSAAVSEQDRTTPLLSSALAASVVPAMLLGLDNRIVWLNRRSTELLGYEAADLLAKPFDCLASQDAGDYAAEERGRLTRGEVSSYQVERRVRCRDGQSRWVLEAGTALDRPAGSGGYMLVQMLDTTVRRNAEDALRKDEARYRVMAENSSDLISVNMPDGTYLYASPASEPLLGFQPEELIGRTPYEFIHPDDLKEVMKYHPTFLDLPPGHALYYRTRRKDGEYVWMETSCQPLDSTEDGRVQEVIAVSRDISDRRRAEEQVRKLSEAVEHSPAMVMITDAQGRIEYVNPKFTQITGYSLQEVSGLNPRLMKSGDMPVEVYADLWQTILRGEDWRGVFRNRKKSGDGYWSSASISPLRSPNGDVTHFVEVSEDITPMKLAEAALMDAKEAAEVANRAKSEFLASMSHEIRTPMNAIIGMADLLGDTELSREQRRYVEVFKSAGANLLALINDVLDLSKVEAGQLTLESVEFDLRELVDKSCEVMAVRAHKKGLELACRTRDGVPSRLEGDPARLRQIITNLLGNAIKFTEQGEVVLEVEIAGDIPPDEGSDDGHCRLHFSVRDSGIGIPPEKLRAVFDRFTQADSSVTRKYGGTGLGLAISKQLVELMGGHLWVESLLGQGSSFHFTAELGLRREGSRLAPASHPDLKERTVLVVDDHPTTRAILGEILAGWGGRVLEAWDVGSALAQLRTVSGGGKACDLLLLDWHLPEPGWSGLIGQSKDEGICPDATIAMIQSDDRDGGPAKLREIGAGGYVVKPVSRGELGEAVGTAMSTRMEPRPAGRAAEPAGPGDSHPLKLLLVEDSEDNRMLILAYLKRTPHQVEIAENGQIAVDRFTTGRYDLVLMDMQMPVMDGYSATRAIREWELQNGLARTPIIALTAHALFGDADKSAEAGCDAHLTKPIKKATLLEELERLARKVKA